TKGKVPQCPETCDNKSDIIRTKVHDWHYVKADQIQEEIYKHGPVTVGFVVYQDFMYYAGGVYIHQKGWIEGFHAVIFIGWGVENDVPYWLAQNSWTDQWGELGYFKILRGKVQCECESNITVGYPDCLEDEEL
ncbi:MAG: putative cathepsin B4 cysteine protease, partial [Streblomastix strix]